VKTAPCIAVYNSSLTIVAIALDRHRVIVHSGRQQVREYIMYNILDVQNVYFDVLMQMLDQQSKS
jgi:hypothetical protein